MSQSPQPPAALLSDEQPILPLCSIFRRFLRRNGLKFTPERAKILDAVLSETAVFEAEQLMEKLRRSESRVSKATVYRTLKHLCDAKIITEVLIDSKQAHYELSFGRKSTGHLVCVETDQIIEFDIRELDAVRDRICKEHGYESVSYRFIIYGVSPEAQKQELAEE
jgi:Fur family ferric uptake transcriptional regulator